MHSWEFASNPPLELKLAAEDEQAMHAWKTIKQQLHLGAVITGKIFARTHFGVFYDAGIGFPVRMNVTDFGIINEKGMTFPDDYPTLESAISGRLVGFDELWHQVVVGSL